MNPFLAVRLFFIPLLLLFFLTGIKSSRAETISQEDRRAYQTHNDSLKELIDSSPLTKETAFEVRKNQGREVYRYRRYKNHLFKISREYRIIKKSKDKTIVETGHEEAYFERRLPFHVRVLERSYLYELGEQIPTIDNPDDSRHALSPWEVYIHYYKGRYFDESSNGHGETESDNWNADVWGKKIAYRLRKAIQKKE